MDNVLQENSENGMADTETVPTQSDKAFSAVMHLTVLLGVIYWPMSWLLCIPLLMWAFGSSSDFINRQGRGIVNFLALYSITFLGLVIAPQLFINSLDPKDYPVTLDTLKGAMMIPYLSCIGLLVAYTVIVIIRGAAHSLAGKVYRYPINIPILKN